MLFFLFVVFAEAFYASNGVRTSAHPTGDVS
jgi:hypothetical protein